MTMKRVLVGLRYKGHDSPPIQWSVGWQNEQTGWVGLERAVNQDHRGFNTENIPSNLEICVLQPITSTGVRIKQVAGDITVHVRSMRMGSVSIEARDAENKLLAEQVTRNSWLDAITIAENVAKELLYNTTADKVVMLKNDEPHKVIRRES